MISGALQVTTTRWRRRGQGKVARQSRQRRDNRGDTTTSWQNRGKREGRHIRGKREGRHQRTRGGGAPRGLEAAVARREASQKPPAAPLVRSLALAAAGCLPRRPQVRHRRNTRVHHRRCQPPRIAAVVAPFGHTARPSGGCGARCKAAAAAAIGAATGAMRS